MGQFNTEDPDNFYITQAQNKSEQVTFPIKDYLVKVYQQALDSAAPDNETLDEKEQRQKAAIEKLDFAFFDMLKLNDVIERHLEYHTNHAPKEHPELVQRMRINILNDLINNPDSF